MSTEPRHHQCSHAPKPRRGKAERCSICCESTIVAHSEDRVADNSLGCSNGHLICMPCVRKLVKPGRLCSYSCSGFQYTCPMCRSVACLTPTHVLAVIKGSQAKAHELVDAAFCCPDQFDTQRVVRREEVDAADSSDGDDDDDDAGVEATEAGEATA